jgi:hypothetical protein
LPFVQLDSSCLCCWVPLCPADAVADAILSGCSVSEGQVMHVLGSWGLKLCGNSCSRWFLVSSRRS